MLCLIAARSVCAAMASSKEAALAGTTTLAIAAAAREKAPVQLLAIIGKLLGKKIVGIPPVRRLLDALVRPAVYWFFHSWRLFGYFYILPPLLVYKPRQTVMALLMYGAVHRQQWWQKAIHKLCGYGASRRHRVVNPSKHLIRDDKRYLWSLHPHSILADGWHSVIARNSQSFEDGAGGPPEIGRSIALCFAPVIHHVPIHQEMYRDKCGGADKASIVKWWKTSDTDPALIPGGFSESVFANAAEKRFEYSYIKDRKGFVKICLEEGKDIVPCYTFKSSWMYNNPGVLKGLRARISQQLHIGLVAFAGKFGTSMPLLNDTTTVVFPPFEVTRFQPDQLAEAHAAYMAHLKEHFDVYKAQYGMPDTELIFVGDDFQDDDPLANGLRKLGILRDGTKKKRSRPAKALPAGPPRSKL